MLDVLSVGHGHMKVTITPGDKVELEKAQRMITDMLARGFSIFVEMADGSTRRVKKFDARKFCYYIDPPDVLDEAPVAAKKPAKGRAKRYAEVPIAKARATAIGRTAGG